MCALALAPRYEMDMDLELEALLRRELLRAHFADEDTDAAFARAVSALTLPDRTYENAHLPGPSITLRQRVLAKTDATGGMIWDSSHMLVDWLLAGSESFSFADRSVLELGAGAGLLSIVIARLGAASVTITDGDAAAIDMALENAALNDVADRVKASVLQWGHRGSSSASGSQMARALECIGRDGKCAHTIVASDVLYNEEAIDQLEETLRELIGCGGCSHVVLGWRGRGLDEANFLRRLSDLGTTRNVMSTHDGPRCKGIDILAVNE